MTTIYYEADADLSDLSGSTVAVVGYGNQGRSWALNLRDSGCSPFVCVRRDPTRELAEADGFDVHDIEAANDADLLCVLVPDDVIPLENRRKFTSYQFFGGVTEMVDDVGPLIDASVQPMKGRISIVAMRV